MGLSNDRILLAAADAAAASGNTSLLHLDIGSGHGDLITLLRAKGLVAHSAACDYTASLMALPDGFAGCACDGGELKYRVFAVCRCIV